jgi:DNA-binding HxlR family transcriptional regulator
MMTVQLRELEDDGLVHRKVFAEVPPKVIYTLTEKGESLRPLFSMLSKWGIEQVLEPKMNATK